MLVSILLPSLTKAREQARAIQCESNLRQWGVGFTAYANQSKGELPLDGIGDGNSQGDAWDVWNDAAVWSNAIPPYVGVRSYYDMQQLAPGVALPGASANSIFVCPDAGTPNPNASGGQDQPATPDGYYYMYGYVEESTPQPTHTIDPKPRKFYWCYVINSKLNDTNSAPRMVQLHPASQIALLVEKMMNYAEAAPLYTPTSINRAKTTWNRFAARHNHGGNILFADGHVAWFSFAELMNAPNAPSDYNQPGKVIWNPFGPG